MLQMYGISFLYAQDLGTNLCICPVFQVKTTDKTEFSTTTHFMKSDSPGPFRSRQEIVAPPPFGKGELVGKGIVAHVNVAVELYNLIIKNAPVGKMEARNGYAA